MGKPTPISEELPIVVRVPVPQETFDAGAIDTKVYCVNTTPHAFRIAAHSVSFTTVDEETGDAVEHGSQPTDILLEPGATAEIADVAGWEWDGHVGIEVVFERADGKKPPARKSYNLKASSTGKQAVPGAGEGWVIPPW